MVGTLAQHLRRKTAKHVLLQNQGVFNQAATLALEDEEVSLRTNLRVTRETWVYRQTGGHAPAVKR